MRRQMSRMLEHTDPCAKDAQNLVVEVDYRRLNADRTVH